MKDSELTQIVKSVQEDKEQFELLYSRIINRVYFWCFTMLGNESTTKDMTQEVMLRVYTKIDAVKQPEYFNSWLYRLVRNICISYLRKNKKHESEFNYEEDFNEDFEYIIKEERKENLPKEAYISNERSELINNFINNLPRKQREVIILFYLEEFKINEIAEILDYNAGSVKSRVHSGRKNLESQINQYQEENDIKLFSSSVFSVLGMVLKEYADRISNTQNLPYNSSKFKDVTNTETTIYKNKNTIFNKLISIVTKNIVRTIVTIVCVSVVIVSIIVSSDLNQLNEDIKDNANINMSSTFDLEMLEKLKSHPYIEDVTYLNFPTRLSINVSIKLKKDIDHSNIDILLNDEKELSFEKNGKDLLVQVTENGMYTIMIKDSKLSFKIGNIDKSAPELVDVKYNHNYIQLIMSDKQSQIDYQKCFVEYEIEMYEIKEDLKVYGVFKDSVMITLTHKNGSYIRYDITFE
ncbi:MAG: RNA polymerase sigma factor [Coprobacillaceae bacterium]